MKTISCTGKGHAVSRSFVRRSYSGQNSKQRIISVLHQTKTPMTALQLEESTGVHLETVKRSLRSLRSDGIIFGEIKNKTKEWSIKV